MQKLKSHGWWGRVIPHLMSWPSEWRGNTASLGLCPCQGVIKTKKKKKESTSMSIALALSIVFSNLSSAGSRNVCVFKTQTLWAQCHIHQCSEWMAIGQDQSQRTTLPPPILSSFCRSCPFCSARPPSLSPVCGPLVWEDPWLPCVLRVWPPV